MAARIEAGTHPWGAGLLFALVGLGCAPAYDYSGCPGDFDCLFFTESEWQVVQEHTNLGEPPSDPTNAYYENEDAARLGQRLFFATDFSGTRPVPDKRGSSCATCHDPEQWFQVVTEDREEGPPRNRPTLVNTAFYEWFSWDGARDSLWSQVLLASEKPMATDRISIVRFMLTEHEAEYVQIFGPHGLDLASLPEVGTPIEIKDVVDDAKANWDALDPDTQTLVNRAFANFGKAIAAYVRKLVSRNSPFDRYAAGELDAISDAAKRGLRLFTLDLPCHECHAGPEFTDHGFHNIGMRGNGRWEAIDKLNGDTFNAGGEFSDDTSEFQMLEKTDADRGKFRTKHLRQIAETGQYMHDGSRADLLAVVRHYRDVSAGDTTAMSTLDPLLRQIAEAELTDDESDDLVAFLETLTGEEIPDDLRGPPE